MMVVDPMASCMVYGVSCWAGVEDADVVMNRFSSTLTQKKSQGASQAMLFATGLKSHDMNKAQVNVTGMD